MNRGEAGEVKTATFGGVQGLRISSQCLKRAVREYMHKRVQETHGYRTVRVGNLLENSFKKLKIQVPKEQISRLGMIVSNTLKLFLVPLLPDTLFHVFAALAEYAEPAVMRSRELDPRQNTARFLKVSNVMSVWRYA